MGSHSLLLGIFPTQGSNAGLAHYKQILYRLSHQGRVTTLSLTVLAISPATENIQELDGILISLNCFTEALIIRNNRQATKDHYAKNIINVDCFYCGLHMLISLFLHFLWFAANFLSYFTKTLIKLLMKHICFELTGKSSGKKQSKRKLITFYIQFIDFLIYLGRKGTHFSWYFEEHMEYNTIAKGKESQLISTQLLERVRLITYFKIMKRTSVVHSLVFQLYIKISRVVKTYETQNFLKKLNYFKGWDCYCMLINV